MDNSHLRAETKLAIAICLHIFFPQRKQLSYSVDIAVSSGLQFSISMTTLGWECGSLGWFPDASWAGTVGLMGGFLI